MTDFENNIMFFFSKNDKIRRLLYTTQTRAKNYCKGKRETYELLMELYADKAEAFADELRKEYIDPPYEDRIPESSLLETPDMFIAYDYFDGGYEYIITTDSKKFDCTALFLVLCHCDEQWRIITYAADRGQILGHAECMPSKRMDDGNINRILQEYNPNSTVHIDWLKDEPQDIISKLRDIMGPPLGIPSGEIIKFLKARCELVNIKFKLNHFKTDTYPFTK